MLSERQRASILAILDSLEGGNALLHGDFHPGNVFVSGDGEPGVIDWGDSSRGQAAADVARTLHLVSPETIPPGLARRDEVMRGAGPFRDVYLQTVLELVGVDEEDIGRWMVPVLAARLDEDIAWERESIMRKIESSI